jgi:NTP pyrophosphatase (non-canonical NTP hydrolase)
VRLSDDVEVISQAYARAHGFTRDETWFLFKLQEEVGELTQAYLMRAGQARSKGNSRQQLDVLFGGELADVLCHVLLLARHHGFDLAEQIERKWLVWHPDRRRLLEGEEEAARSSQLRGPGRVVSDTVCRWTGGTRQVPDALACAGRGPGLARQRHCALVPRWPRPQPPRACTAHRDGLAVVSALGAGAQSSCAQGQQSRNRHRVSDCSVQHGTNVGPRRLRRARSRGAEGILHE